MNDPERLTTTQKSRRVYWIFQLMGWGFYTLLRFIGGVVLLGFSWIRLALELLLVDALGLLFSHLLREFVRRHHWTDLPHRKLIWRIIVAAFVLATPFGIATQLTDLSAFHDPAFLKPYATSITPQFSLSLSIVVEIVNWAFIFIMWLIIYFAAIGVREHRSAQFRQSELARALQLAELRLLKSQLNPHFLFNALNTVRSLITDNPLRAQSAVTRLANTLRYTLSPRQDELVALSQELDIVADYLEVESMRFEDRLRIEIQVSDAAAAVQIPVMLLQTLVENGIKHGIAHLPLGGLLRISAGLQDAVLNLEVENPRPPVPIPGSHEGVGLRNTRDRLRLLFGGRASLELDLSKPAVATVRLRIPVSK